MTREEIIKRLRTMKFAWALTADATPEAQETVAWATEAINGAIKALKGPTREQVEKMRGEIVETVENGRMKRVFSCCGCDFTSLTCWITPKFCPSCGAPMTDEAVDMVMERLEEMQNDQ